jgi:hypothetical protein
MLIGVPLEAEVGAAVGLREPLSCICDEGDMHTHSSIQLLLLSVDAKLAGANEVASC